MPGISWSCRDTSGISGTRLQDGRRDLRKLEGLVEIGEQRLDVLRRELRPIDERPFFPPVVLDRDHERVLDLPSAGRLDRAFRTYDCMQLVAGL